MTNFLVRVSQSFLLVPGVMCVLAVVLAQTLIMVGRRSEDGGSGWGVISVLVTTVGESGSRDLLGAIAGSMLTVASTTFSITVAVLALSSSTYGPRLVRNFMADRGNQVVLGVFVATFLYCLLVLRSIRVVGDGAAASGQPDYFVPHLAVNVAVLLAVVAIGVLVYFIHHISDSVQVSTLSRRVRRDLLGTVDRMYPDAVPEPGPADAEPVPDLLAAPVEGVVPVPAGRMGYVQGIHHAKLLALAVEHDLVISVRARPGDFVHDSSVLAAVVPASAAAGGAAPPGLQRDLQEGTLDKVAAAVLVGPARAPEQDVEFAVLVLEEIAVRALSPGTNDPYTAVNALDDLAVGLARLAARPVPSPYHYDDRHRLRVVVPVVALDELLDHVCDAMRVYASEHPTVLHRTLHLLVQVGEATTSRTVRTGLVTRAEQLLEAFRRTAPQSCDLDALTRRVREVRSTLLGGVPTTAAP